MPSLFESRSAKEYFVEFISLNRTRRGFSQRSIADKLNWPVSYIPDVIYGRKKFTLARALQFARHFRFAPIDQEKIILLSLESLGLVAPMDAELMRSKKTRARKQNTQDLDLLDARLLLVFECIRWLKTGATLEKIGELTARLHFSRTEIEDYIQVLLKKHKVEARGANFISRCDAIFSDDPGDVDDSKIHRQFVDFLDHFFQSRIGPAIYNSGFVHIDRSRFEEIADRMVALRNWIFEISSLDQALPKVSDVRLFQLDMNLTPVFSKELAAKLRSEK